MHKIRNIFTVLLASLLTICALYGCGQENGVEQKTSSIRRTVSIEQEDEIYVASTAEMVLFERRTVSGNTIETVSGNTLGTGVLSLEVASVLEQMNKARKDIGLSELVWNDDLAVAAEIRAEEITTVFSHKRPNGTDWWTVDEDVVYGENLAKGYQSADDVMKAWMKSPEHKDNILYPGFQKIGIAVYELNGQWYWAQEFGY